MRPQRRLGRGMHGRACRLGVRGHEKREESEYYDSRDHCLVFRHWVREPKYKDVPDNSLTSQGETQLQENYRYQRNGQPRGCGQKMHFLRQCKLCVKENNRGMSGHLTIRNILCLCICLAGG